MYAALNEQGKLVYAEQLIDAERVKSLKWYCPTCRQAMIFCQGGRKRPYFAHQNGSCRTGLANKRLTRESKRHVAAKRLLGSWLVQQGAVVCLEQVLASDQIADVYLANYHMIMEFQHTAIAQTLLQMRHQQYRQQGYQVLWLMDSQHLIEKFDSQWKRSLLLYQAAYGYYWLALDVDNRQFCWQFQLPLVYSRCAYRYQEQCINLMELNWRQLLEGTPDSSTQHEQKMSDALPFDYATCYAQYLMQYPQVLQALYQAGIQLNQVPTWCLTGRYHCLASRTAGWIWLAWQWGFLQQFMGQTVDLEAWQAYLWQLIESGQLVWSAPPLLDSALQFFHDVCVQWLQVWAHWGYIVWETPTAFRVKAVETSG